MFKSDAQAYKFGATFVVPEGNPQFEQIKKFEGQKALNDMGRNIQEKVKPEEYADIVPGHKTFGYRLIVMTPEEYEKLVDYEWKYKDLQK